MAISLQGFRDKTRDGPDAERLEINRAGTGLHRKGISGGGRAVEWLRDAVGARKTENRQVMHAFVAALKTEHGDLIAGEVETVLQGHESKPLSSRQVRQLISDADTIRNGLRRKNEALAQLYAPDQENDRALGYMSAVLAARQATGASDDLVATLFDYSRVSSQPAQVRRAIRDAIEAAGQDGKRVVTHDEARVIAQRAITEFLLRRMAIEGLGSERLNQAFDSVQNFSQQMLEARLLSSAGASAHFEQNVMRAMGSKLASLDNTDLLAVYRTTLSSDMLELRLELANRPDDPRAQWLLQDLNNWEGMVHMEVAERSLAGLPDTGLKPQLSGAHLEMLSGVDRAAAKKELVQQSDEYLKGAPDAARSDDPAAVRRLQGKSIGVPEVTQMMRSADLTINLPEYLFEPGVAFIGEDGSVKPSPQLQNIFDRPIEEKGPAYVERRQIIEHAEVPGLKEREKSGIDPSLHPYSAALNVGRGLGGAAPTYGALAFLVLKDQVKERATFTPTDSFYTFTATLDRDNIAHCKARLAQLTEGDSNLSEEGRTALGSLLPQINQDLDNAVGRSFGLGHPQTFEDFFHDEIGSEVLNRLQTSGDKEYVYNVMLDSVIDRSREANRVASYERLGQVIGDLQDATIDSLESGAKDRQRVNLPINDGKYVEAQVFGGIDLTKDVKAIHFMDFPPGEGPPGYDNQRAGIEALAKSLNVPVVLFKQHDPFLTRLKTDESVQATFPQLENGSITKKIDSLDAFKTHELPAILDQYREHEQTFDPTGIHGRRHISRALIYANVLANVFREKGAQIDSYALYTTTAFHDAGRQGNGTDVWEEQSAEKAVEHMKGRGIDDPDYLKFGAASINSEAPKWQKSLEGGILKSADSLDIIRVKGREGYRKDLLWFMFQDTRVGKNNYVKADADLRDKLIDEVARFIEATEPKTPSEIELEKVTAEFNAVNQQLLANPEDRREAETLNERLETRMGHLNKTAIEEHKAMNAQLDSGELFASIERELLDHPEKYPTLAAYYNPAK